MRAPRHGRAVVALLWSVVPPTLRRTMATPLAHNLIALPADQLQPGMYVAELDRLWLDTPFPARGFYIKEREQIEQLRRFCSYVYIDPEKSDFTTSLSVPLAPQNANCTPLRHVTMIEEMPNARMALEALTGTVTVMVRKIRSGRLPDIVQLQKSLLPVVASIQRCPDALLWLIRTERVAPYLYRRALGTTVLAAAFGHHLGLERSAIMELALGGVLLDIGKVEIPVPILVKPAPMSPEENWFIKRHVQLGAAMVRLVDEVPERVTGMVEGHHERSDGSGYPHQWRGSGIPLFARLAGIVDTFDALTLERRYAPAIAAHTALKVLNAQRQLKFDGALVGEFIHALGVYPTGSWVEFADGSVGVVCSQNPGWPLAPRVAIMSDTSGRAMASPRIVEPDRTNPIARALNPDMLDINRPTLDAVIKEQS